MWLPLTDTGVWVSGFLCMKFCVCSARCLLFSTPLIPKQSKCEGWWSICRVRNKQTNTQNSAVPFPSAGQSLQLKWKENHIEKKILSLDEAIFLFFSFRSVFWSLGSSALTDALTRFLLQPNTDYIQSSKGLHSNPAGKPFLWGLPFISSPAPSLGYHHLNVASSPLSESSFSVHPLTTWCPDWSWQMARVLNKTVPVKYGWLA